MLKVVLKVLLKVTEMMLNGNCGCYLDNINSKYKFTDTELHAPCRYQGSYGHISGIYLQKQTMIIN